MNAPVDTPINPIIALIGNAGRMGAMLHSRLSAAGFVVRGVDRTGDTPPTPKTIAHACADADIVLICVPAAAFDEVLQHIVPHIPPHAVLADIASVKVRPVEQMDAAWHGPVVGTHPLFGPEPGLDMPVALTPGARAEAIHIALVQNMFTRIACRVFVTTAEKHDRAMAAIQGLNFISSVAYFAALAEQEDLLPFITPSFLRRKDAARKQLTEDAALFEGLFEANPYSQEMVRQYRAYLNLASAGDISLIVQRAAWWWRGAGDASRNS